MNSSATTQKDFPRVQSDALAAELRATISGSIVASRRRNQPGRAELQRGCDH